MNIIMRILFATSFILTFQLSFSQFTNILIDDAGTPEEPSIFINPNDTNNLVAGSNIDNVYYSFDGGLTWQEQSLQSTFGVWGDPCIITDTAGNFYFFHLSNPQFGNWIDRIVCQKSTDGGITWNDGSFMGLNGSKAQDKEWAIVDQQTNAIYVTWTQFDDYGSSNPNDSSVILFSKSVDEGNFWSPALRINRWAGDCIDSDNTAEGAVPCVGPDGEVYVIWSNRDTLFFDRSLDQGQTWMDNDLIVDLQPGGWDYQISGLQRCNGLPILRCDLSGSPYHGTIYANWSDQRNGSADTDVWFSKSTDGGNTWSTALRVNDDGIDKQQFLCWMDVDQTSGFIYIIFYDRRNYSDSNTDVFIAYSTNGGITFTNQLISDAPFVPNTSVFFGDYSNISVHNGKIAPIWTRQDGFETSLWTAVLDFPTLIENNALPLPTPFILHQNYPNPFSSSTRIEIELNESGYYALTLFDLAGRKVTDVFKRKFLKSGEQSFMLDSETLPGDGTYYYTLSRNNEMITKKLIMVNQ